MTTLLNELARGTAAESGVASVRDGSAGPQANLRDPVIKSANRYRLALSWVQAGAMMFMATGAKSAAYDIRDATNEAATSMAAIASSQAPEGIKQDAHMVDTIGSGIAKAANDLVGMSEQLDQVAGVEVEASSKAMRAAFEKLADSAETRGSAAAASAVLAGGQAATDIVIMVAVITLVMVALGAAVTVLLSGPIRRLTRSVQTIAGGKTDEVVPYTTWNDEVGKMAASVETLRGVIANLPSKPDDRAVAGWRHDRRTHR